MKKIYKAPLTQVVKVNAEQMICESFALNQSKEYNSGSMTIADKEDEDFVDDLW